MALGTRLVSKLVSRRQALYHYDDDVGEVLVTPASDCM